MALDRSSPRPARLAGWLVFAAALAVALGLFATQAPGLPNALVVSGLEAVR